MPFKICPYLTQPRFEKEAQGTSTVSLRICSKRGSLFLIAVNRERTKLFSVIVNESAPVIREITNLFLVIREHGL